MISYFSREGLEEESKEECEEESDEVSMSVDRYMGSLNPSNIEGKERCASLKKRGDGSKRPLSIDPQCVDGLQMCFSFPLNFRSQPFKRKIN